MHALIRTASVVAGMLDADCECRKRLIEYARAAEQEHLSSLLQLRARLSALIEPSYASVSANLLREFRIFAGSNAVAFLLLGAVALRRKGAALQLALPALALCGAVLIVGGLYVLSQDWLHTNVHNQYVGFGYTIHLALVGLLLADVLLNRARVATRLVNAALGVVGSAAAAARC